VISTSPDTNAQGFTRRTVDPLRYDGHTTDPHEAAGMILRLVKPKARILDVGCGTGSLSRLLLDHRDVSLIGVEPDPLRAELARQRGIEVLTSPLDENAVETLGTFDQVIFADVLEHLPDPATVLRLAANVLTQDGEVIASIPNVAHWSVRWDLLRGRFEYAPFGIMDATHLRWFTTVAVEQLFEACGLTIRSMEHTAGVNLPVYSQNAIWRRIPRATRNSMVRRLTRGLPTMFGCQHVVRAVRNA
jgi:methionine biosynthesis protein MetW